MVLAQPTLPHPPPSNKSVTRLVPTPLCGRHRPAWAQLAEGRRGDPQSRSSMCGSAGGTEGAAPAGGSPAAGASRRHPLGGAVDGPGRQHLGPARPQPADPASAPHPFLADSRPRPRDGTENHSIPRPARPQLQRGSCSPGPGDRRRQPTLTHREPASALPAPAPRPSPPPRGRRG